MNIKKKFQITLVKHGLNFTIRYYKSYISRIYDVITNTIPWSAVRMAIGWSPSDWGFFCPLLSLRKVGHPICPV